MALSALLAVSAASCDWQSSPPPLLRPGEVRQRVWRVSLPKRVLLCGRRVRLWFETIILALILVSSIALAIEDPATREDEELMSVLRVLEVVLTSLFTVESLLKSVAHGLVFTKGAYLRNVYNAIDFAVVISSLVNLGLSSTELNAVRVLRLTRCLRPLRLIARNKVRCTCLATCVWATRERTSGPHHAGGCVLLCRACALW